MTLLVVSNTVIVTLHAHAQIYVWGFTLFYCAHNYEFQRATMASMSKKGMKYQDTGRLLQGNKFAEKLAEFDESKLYNREEYSDSDFCDQSDVFLPDSGGTDGVCLCN
jgi:hypothetical protein